MPISIERIYFPVPGMDLLQSAARVEGYKFIDRLVDDWSSVVVRFDRPGEILCGCLQDNLIVAVGGVTRDPFATADNVGRIRPIYVKPEMAETRRGSGSCNRAGGTRAKNFCGSSPAG
jgi:hypothetical protein